MKTIPSTLMLSLSLLAGSYSINSYLANAAPMQDMPMPAGKMDTAKGLNGKGTVDGKGVVVSVNKDGSSVVLKHEAIPAIQWSAMTMSFKVKDKTQLDTLKKGDKVEFSLVPDGKEYKIDSIK